VGLAASIIYLPHVIFQKYYWSKKIVFLINKKIDKTWFKLMIKKKYEVKK